MINNMQIKEDASFIMLTPARDFLLETPWRIIIDGGGISLASDIETL
jgi:hypothetical protein